MFSFIIFAMQIHFGNKIPISKTKIYDTKEQCYKKATLYELDGKDKTDVDELSKHTEAWTYKHLMATDLCSKHNQLMHQEDLSEFQKHLCEHNKFYTLETEDGKLAAICETNGFLNNSDIHFLEKNPENKYGLAGQTMLAGIAKHILKSSGGGG